MLTHTYASLSDRESRTRVSSFALTFEYYQPVVLSNDRLASDSDMPVVELSLSPDISDLLACHSSSCHFLSYFTLFDLIFSVSYVI